MTPQQIDAMKLALEALKWCHGGEPCGTSEAITAIEEVLAEHAMRETQRLGQEIEPKIGCVNHDCDQCKAQPEQEPVAWVSEDVCKGQYIDGRPRKIWWECRTGVGTAFYTTPPQRKPLTIAWFDPSNGVVSTDQDCPLFTPLGQVWPLYPKREWVGLTDEQANEYNYLGPDMYWVAQEIETILKEKNNG